MSAAHTPEPWKYAVNVGPTKGLIVDDKGFTILALDNEMRCSRFEANIRRIVECVNAYRGAKIEEVKSDSTHIANLIQQRDELMDALQNVRAEAHAAWERLARVPKGVQPLRNNVLSIETLCSRALAKVSA